MRMWMVDPKIMCRKHLLGEHVEHHMFIGTLRKRKKVDGYIRNNCLQPRALFERHNVLVCEMQRRGYNHKTPIAEEDCEICYLPQEQQYWEINCTQSMKDLLERCPECRTRKEQLDGSQRDIHQEG